MLRGYDPVRETAHWTLICDGIARGLLTAATLFEAAQMLLDPEVMIQQHLLVVIELVLLFAFPTWLLIGWITSFLSFRSKTARALHLRQTVLEGSTPLCTPPSQEPLPITLPYTLRVHIGKGFLKQHWFELVMGVALIIALFVIQGNASLSLAEDLRFMSVLLIPLLLIPTGMISKLVESRSATPALTLTDDSITAHYLADHVTIRWDEIQRIMFIDQACTYELSDGANTIRWVDISAKANNPYVPTMEPTQYAALMQTLPHWICTRTGLPLYNVSNQ